MTDFRDLGRDLNNAFTSFGDESDLVRDAILDCRSPLSGPRTLAVQSDVTTFRDVATPDSETITIRNLYACKGRAERGDSGAIVFNDDRAVGIVVAKADDDWVFIHALAPAIDNLSALLGEPLICF